MYCLRKTFKAYEIHNNKASHMRADVRGIKRGCRCRESIIEYSILLIALKIEPTLIF